MFGNINTTLRPLRQQFYYEIGLKDEDIKIREYYPEWDKKTKKVYWVDELVPPVNDEEKMRGLLMNPFMAIEYFFGEYFDGRI